MLPPARAGVGSAVNDATRELGGTLGVAVVGSIFSSVYAAHLADGRVRPAAGRRAGRGAGLGRRRPGGRRPVGPQLRAALQDAFMAGLRTSSLVIGLLCLAGAVAAAFALPGRLPRPVVEPRSCPRARSVG